MKMLALSSTLLASAMLITAAASADGAAIGRFEGQSDIGAPKLPGTASYENSARRYVVSASGANMFGAHDEFHFVWRRMTGDFVIRARVSFTGPGVEAHRKAGLMARASLAPDSAYIDGTVHGNGPVALQVRRSNGGNTEMLVASVPGATPAGPMAPGALPAGPMMAGAAPPDRPQSSGTPPPRFVQLERHGNVFTYTVWEEGKRASKREISDVALGRDLYVGLFLCAHNPGVTERAVFDNLMIKARPAGKTSAGS